MYYIKLSCMIQHVLYIMMRYILHLVDDVLAHCEDTNYEKWASLQVPLRPDCQH